MKKQGYGVNGIYNQDFSPKVMLVEVGGQYNNISGLEGKVTPAVVIYNQVSGVIENYIYEEGYTPNGIYYEKAESWYGSPLPYNIEERIAKELYGDIVYKIWSEIVQEENPKLKDTELETSSKITIMTISDFINASSCSKTKLNEYTNECITNNWLNNI